MEEEDVGGGGGLAVLGALRGEVGAVAAVRERRPGRGVVVVRGRRGGRGIEAVVGDQSGAEDRPAGGEGEGRKEGGEGEAARRSTEWGGPGRDPGVQQARPRVALFGPFPARRRRREVVPAPARQCSSRGRRFSPARTTKVSPTSFRAFPWASRGPAMYTT